MAANKTDPTSPPAQCKTDAENGAWVAKASLCSCLLKKGGKPSGAAVFDDCATCMAQSDTCGHGYCPTTAKCLYTSATFKPACQPTAQHGALVTSPDSCAAIDPTTRFKSCSTCNNATNKVS